MENNNSKRYYLSNFLISLFTGLFLLFSISYSYFYLLFNLFEISFVIFTCIILYCIVLVVLISTSSARRGYLKDRRGETDIIKAIVKEVNNQSEKEMPIIVSFVGDTKSKMYHKVDCKLASKVDVKYRLENNSEEFFRRRKFKKCKTCFKK